jgi:phospholipase/carboxylesterase
MKQPGDLIHDAAYAFAFRLLEPRPERARRLLLLLHGVGGAEDELAPLGARVDAATAVALPRAQRAISGAGYGWFREAFGGDGRQIVAEEAEESRLKMIAFVAQLQSRFEVPPACTVLAGFSQGGMLAASVALTAAGEVAGFASCGGRLLREIQAQLSPRPQLERLEALLLHGRDDEVLPPAWAEQADAQLIRLGVPHETRVYPAGHALTPEMRDDFRQWFAAPARRWNRDPDTAAAARR